MSKKKKNKKQPTVEDRIDAAVPFEELSPPMGCCEICGKDSSACECFGKKETVPGYEADANVVDVEVSPEPEPAPEPIAGPLSIYREERWLRLEKRGYVWVPKKNRANLGHPTKGTVAQPEKGDPGFVEDTAGE